MAHAFHAAGLVDRYVFYLAPALFGGDDGRPVFAGPGAPTMAELWRGRLVSVETAWVRTCAVELAPVGPERAAGGSDGAFATPCDEAIEAIGRGEMVVVVDDEDRENEGDLVMAAEAATPENDRLLPRPHLGRDLRPAHARAGSTSSTCRSWSRTNTESQRTAFTVRSTTATARPPASPPPTGRPRSAALIDPDDQADRPQPARATSSRCATGRAAC